MKPIDSVVLPLYSTRSRLGDVPAKSGLNQWNADGRGRDLDEAYISVPAKVHDTNPTFFPERDVPFLLRLPNGTHLTAKMCQEGRKALMTNPNRTLGKWILRDVLNIKRGTLVSRQMLDDIGIDSVIVRKEREGLYSIDARPDVHYRK